MSEEIIKVSPDDLKCPDSILRRKSSLTTEYECDVKSIVSQLIYTLYNIEYGTGLSAVQIGIPVRIAVVNLSRIPGAELIMIDPIVISISGRITARSEGCLSLPNYKGLVTRRNKITFKTFNLENEQYIYSAKGYEAAVVQHEIDHMDGLFYWDRMKEYSAIEKII